MSPECKSLQSKKYLKIRIRTSINKQTKEYKVQKSITNKQTMSINKQTMNKEHKNFKNQTSR